MEMNSARIFALGVLGLAAALLFPFIQSYMLFAMALSPLVLLVVGQFYLPRSKRAIQVWFNPIVIEAEGELTPFEPGTPIGRLSGKVLAYSFFKQWHDFEIVTHRFLFLGGIGLISLGATWLVWWFRDGLFRKIGFFYVITSVWVVVVLLAKRWVWERRMLRREGVSIGSFSVKDNDRPPYRQILYHFVDPSGQYRGGCFDSFVCDRADDMTIIFYDETDPEQSIPASGLMFHRLAWKET